jgi:hypothetical protein
MPIVVACSCGKQFRAKDEHAGKRLRCPGCGQPLTIPGGGGAAAAAGLPTTKHSFGAGPQKQQPGLHISFSAGQWVLIGIAILIPAFVIFIKLGPLKARDDWNRISSKAEYDITDVTGKAIRSLVPPVRGHPPPSVKSVAFMTVGGLMMSVPDDIGFTGMSDVGGFKGHYFPKTGEVEVELTHWGQALKITGRVKEKDNDKDIQAEVNGKKAVELPPLNTTDQVY